MILIRKSALSVLTSGVALAIILSACGGSDDASADKSSTRVKNAALIPASTTSLVAGGNMTQPTVVLASTTTLRATTLTTTPGIALTPRSTTTLVAGGNMTQPTVVLASTTTLQSSTIFGQRWVGKTFEVNAIDAAKTPTCTNVAAPTGLAQSSGSVVTWASTMAPPATNDTADLVYLESSTDGAKWAAVAYTRSAASSAQLLGTKVGQKFQLRAAFYRSGTNACIGKVSAAITVTIK